MGQFFTFSDGGGIRSVLSCAAVTKVPTESANEFIKAQDGMTNKEMPTMNTIVEASFCLPPILRATH